MPRAAKTPVDKLKTAPPTGRQKVKGLNVKRREGGTSQRVPQVAEVRSRGMDTGSYENAAKVDENKPLTQMQKDFVKAWAAGETILSASQRAGYADGGTYAYRMCRMPNILKLYNAEKAAYELASGLSRKKVMDMLVEAYDMAKLAGEPASMVAAARECGKMLGYYEPVRHKIDVNVSGNVVVERLNRMTDAELLELITQNDAIPQLEHEESEP